MLGYMNSVTDRNRARKYIILNLVEGKAQKLEFALVFQ
jgi:hypothetical protein